MTGSHSSLMAFIKQPQSAVLDRKEAGTGSRGRNAERKVTMVSRAPASRVIPLSDLTLVTRQEVETSFYRVCGVMGGAGRRHPAGRPPPLLRTAAVRPARVLLWQRKPSPHTECLSFYVSKQRGLLTADRLQHQWNVLSLWRSLFFV